MTFVPRVTLTSTKKVAFRCSARELAGDEPVVWRDLLHGHGGDLGLLPKNPGRRLGDEGGDGLAEVLLAGVEYRTWMKGMTRSPWRLLRRPGWRGDGPSM